MNTWDSLSRVVKDITTGDVTSTDTRPVRDVYAQGMMAPQYSALTFPVAAGAHCIYEGELYAAKQAIAASEAWTAAHWDKVQLGAEVAKVGASVTDLKSAITGIADVLNYSLDGGETTVTDTFNAYARKVMFDNLALEANVKYKFTFSFPSASQEQGYGAVSKSDGTTPDYDSVSFLNKQEAVLYYTPSADMVVDITARFNSKGTYTVTCKWEVDVDDYVTVLRSDVSNLKTTTSSLENLTRLQERFYNSNKKCYDHLFVNRTGTNCIIPSESVFHVRVSKSFGYDMIEANVQKTSDNNYFVHHLASDGTFGNYFHHVDGVTDISNIAASSVTWGWIVENVRYNSQIAKYQTAPCSLEEFLRECRQQNVLPFLYMVDENVASIADGIMGVNNYISYDGTRVLTPDAIIYKWKRYTTKQEIVAYCESIGTPMIYGMANPDYFSDSELKDIIGTLHSKGFWVGTGYAGSTWYKYDYLGMDFLGATKSLNRIEEGNLANYETIFGFNDFVVTNGTVSDGKLVFSETGTVAPDIDNTTYQLCGIDIEIAFNGTISIPRIGEADPAEFTSDGSYPVYMSIPIVNGSPLITITASANTEIIDIKYKASVF